jgi:thioester reductase-like protein
VSTFITGATGYLGSYVVARLLETQREPLVLLVRGKSKRDAQEKLWKALQLHMPFAQLEHYLETRIEIALGDITEPHCGLSPAYIESLKGKVRSIVHIAAALNRRSDRVCQDVNLRGTLEVVTLARALHEASPLRRFSHVSTTAVAGERNRELIHEDSAIDFARRDYDPYARTKKFCEHMVDTLLPDVPVTVFRPASVIGDTRFAATSQFDMIRAVAMLARMTVLPLRPDARHDIVPADYVGYAIADIHSLEAPKHRIYHLSAGLGSQSSAQMMDNLRLHGRALPHVFAPKLGRPFGALMDAAASSPRAWGLSGVGSMMQVFWPYVEFDTVFDNTRVVEQLGHAPKSFGAYGSATLDFAVDNGFAYPYLPWPKTLTSVAREGVPSRA